MICFVLSGKIFRGDALFDSFKKGRAVRRGGRDVSDANMAKMPKGFEPFNYVFELPYFMDYKADFFP